MTSTLWEKDQAIHQVGTYKGFPIMAQRNGTLVFLYVQGDHTYQANLNTDNPIGTIYSIEGLLRSLDKHAQEELKAPPLKEKALADYTEQLNRPFAYDDQLRALLLKQQELNKPLDLDKHETQVVAEVEQGV